MNGGEQGLNDYILIRGIYVSKSLIFRIFIGILLLPALVITVAIPVYEKCFGDKTLYINSEALPVFNGSSKVYDLDGGLLYDGGIINGAFEGEGKLYISNGNLVYNGGFAENNFNGFGELYYPDGILKYYGYFTDSMYNGYGELYSEDGSVIYKGNFNIGLYDGQGYLKIDERYAYEGAFENGRRTGNGALYRNSSVLYTGEFLKDVYNGQGRLYDNGRLLYEGMFESGLYSGQGCLYSEQERLYYQGAFTKGLKNGFGIQYADNGTPLYEGLFINGYIDYESLLGKSYDEIKRIFKSREYLFDYKEVKEKNANVIEGEAAETEITETVIYYCSVFQYTNAAVIMGVIDGEPAYAEVICVWEGTPANIKAVSDTARYEKTPEWLMPVMQYFNMTNEVLFRRLYVLRERAVQISLWSETEKSGELFYTVEYIVDNEDK